VRPFNFRQKSSIPIYAAPDTFAVIRRVFEYAFDDRERMSSTPKIDARMIDTEPFDLFGLTFEPVPVLHGNQTIRGFRFGNVAYLTDHSAIPDSSLRRLEGLDVLFLDALRHKPHPTHSTVETSIATAQALRPRKTYFTHICHDLPHAATESALPPGIFLAYDGLEIEA
jgi:phosphoribosyl 1,2-cyclic phosphate phosphodiesterase